MRQTDEPNFKIQNFEQPILKLHCKKILINICRQQWRTAIGWTDIYPIFMVCGDHMWWWHRLASCNSTLPQYVARSYRLILAVIAIQWISVSTPICMYKKRVSNPVRHRLRRELNMSRMKRFYFAQVRLNQHELL